MSYKLLRDNRLRGVGQIVSTGLRTRQTASQHINPITVIDQLKDHHVSGS